MPRRKGERQGDFTQTKTKGFTPLCRRKYFGRFNTRATVAMRTRHFCDGTMYNMRWRPRVIHGGLHGGSRRVRRFGEVGLEPLVSAGRAIAAGPKAREKPRVLCNDVAKSRLRDAVGGAVLLSSRQQLGFQARRGFRMFHDSEYGGSFHKSSSGNSRHAPVFALRDNSCMERDTRKP